MAAILFDLLRTGTGYSLTEGADFTFDFGSNARNTR